MKITDNDLHYGAALKQVADDPSFKSINGEWDHGSKSQCAFRVNQDIGLYVKMSNEPRTKRFQHYIFNFKDENLAEIRKLKKRCPKTFIVLVCLKDREICVIDDDYLEHLIALREKLSGTKESQHNVHVKVKKGGSLRVYMNVAGSKLEIVEDARVVPRNAFPRVIFE